MKSFADMTNTGEERLVLYAQMANLVQMMVDFDDVEIKEVTKDFCRVSKHLDFVFPSRNEIGWDSGSGDAVLFVHFQSSE